MASSIIALSIDDSIASQEGCSMACMAFPWLVTLGFSITWSSLLAKISRLNKVMNGARAMRRVVVKEQEASLPIIIFFLINFVLLLCWSFIDPLKWQREPITENDRANTYGFCASEGIASVVFATLLLGLDLLALVLACVQAYRARKMDDELTESRWVGFACASWIQVLVIGIPVILLTREQPIASYFTHTALVFLTCTSMLVLIFLPKMLLVSGTSVRRSLSNIVSRRGRRAFGRVPSRTFARVPYFMRRLSSVERETNAQEASLARESLYQSRIRELEQTLEECASDRSMLAKKVIRESKISTTKGMGTLSEESLHNVSLDDSSVEGMETGHKVALKEGEENITNMPSDPVGGERGETVRGGRQEVTIVERFIPSSSSPSSPPAAARQQAVSWAKPASSSALTSSFHQDNIAGSPLLREETQGQVEEAETKQDEMPQEEKEEPLVVQKPRIVKEPAANEQSVLADNGGADKPKTKTSDSDFEEFLSFIKGDKGEINKDDDATIETKKESEEKTILCDELLQDNVALE
eukprot:CAMPEP_0172547588 /NCGR_PEP_ID=MMETSP1067-20121228/17078_1 /TAXON_ID=265564 ORGANISM="Thalassiosira punctigera, Strain Tpunct2005C2" /NCGR_SAMPLE_ID=MMETSP1067 /ASSEMBLY_ACC=CAM_ASM_000444 /LENGTH=528 /DNA_ID=CAMNT_0013334693 /DNA_START=36 /DNA_END=1619 /DNA_ORIENTATION=+